MSSHSRRHTRRHPSNSNSSSRPRQYASPVEQNLMEYPDEHDTNNNNTRTGEGAYNCYSGATESNKSTREMHRDTRYNAMPTEHVVPNQHDRRIQQSRNEHISHLFSPPRARMTRANSKRQTSHDRRMNSGSNAIGQADTFDIEAEFGQNVLHLPLGSFADDSPIRGSLSEEDYHRVPSPSHNAHLDGDRPSEYAHHSHRSQHRPAHYAYDHKYKKSRPRDGHAAISQQGRAMHGWRASPTSLDGSFAPPESKLRSSPQQSVDMQSRQSTPELQRNQNPFRSPPTTLRRSPIQPNMSPNFGSFDSFGIIDTPRNTFIDTMSPMGPQFEGLGDNVLPHADDGYDGRLSFSRTFSRDSDVALVENSQGQAQSQDEALSKDSLPLTDLANQNLPFSNEIRGVARSPVTSEKIRRDSLPLRVVTAQPRSTSPSKRPRFESTPRKLWNVERPLLRGSGLRVELGQGMQSSLEGINKMMRASKTPRISYNRSPASHEEHPQASPPSSTQPYSSSKRYIETKSNLPRSSPIQHSQPQRMSPPYSVSSHYPSPTQMPSVRLSEQGLDIPTRLSYRPPSITQQEAITSAKEQSRSTTPQQKRQVCNCKKSRCLKLYCDCFSAEIFCDGCKCLDCNNIPMYNAIREKAINDTRAKNPNAFKPRFAPTSDAPTADLSTHNMGCRCKRSACLKKYCECFQAGVLCSLKCKCSGCENRAGSQKLIDKRRKMKDKEGTEFAMRVSEDSWKGRHQPAVHSGGRSPSHSRSHDPHAHMAYYYPTSHGRYPPYPYYHPTYGHGYQHPRGDPGATAAYPSHIMSYPHGYEHYYATPNRDRATEESYHERKPPIEKPPLPPVPSASEAVSKTIKKPNSLSGDDEGTTTCFGSNVKITKASLYKILSYLSPKDMSAVALVSKEMNSLVANYKI